MGLIPSHLTTFVQNVPHFMGYKAPAMGLFYLSGAGMKEIIDQINKESPDCIRIYGPPYARHKEFLIYYSQKTGDPISLVHANLMCTHQDTFNAWLDFKKTIDVIRDK